MNLARFVFLDPTSTEFYRYNALELPADRGRSIVADSAQAGSPARHALDLVASWSSTPDQTPAATADTDP